MKFDITRYHRMTWVLIYGGMLGIGIGLALQRAGQSWDVAVMVLGGLAIAAGIVMIWLRSRRPDPD